MKQAKVHRKGPGARTSLCWMLARLVTPSTVVFARKSASFCIRARKGHAAFCFVRVQLPAYFQGLHLVQDMTHVHADHVGSLAPSLKITNRFHEQAAISSPVAYTADPWPQVLDDEDLVITGGLAGIRERMAAMGHVMSQPVPR